jgi:hypothetical protein
MPEDTITETASKSSDTPTSNAGQSVSLNASHVLGFCAIGLGICFFLPWFNIIFAKPSGFDFAKEGGVYLLLWLLPFFCILTVFAGVTNTSQQNAAVFTGIMPFVILGIGCFNFGADLLKALEFGGYAGLGLGLALIVLGASLKK